MLVPFKGGACYINYYVAYIKKKPISRLSIQNTTISSKSRKNDRNAPETTRNARTNQHRLTPEKLQSIFQDIQSQRDKGL